MLKRKPKKRYICVTHGGSSAEAIDALSKRFSELFGSIALERSGLRLMRAESGMIIVRCGLPEVHAILVTIALMDPPMVAVGMSGSIRRLGRRLSELEGIHTTK